MRLSILTLLVVFSIKLNAQELLSPQLGYDGSDFLKYQENLDAWKNAQNADGVNGYKWIERWSNFYNTRTDGSGNLVSNQDFLQAAVQVAQIKSGYNASRASDSTWSPEGPDTLVAAYDPGSSHGVARVNCMTFHPSDTGTYWVGVAQGGIWKTTNSGQSYTPLNNNLPILRISDIAVDPNNPDVLYVSLGDYAYLGVALSTDGRKRNTHYGMGVYKSTDGGMSWSPTGLSFTQTQFDQSLIRRVFVDPSNSQNLVAGGISGVWTSSDGGGNWNQVMSDPIWDFEMNPDNPKSLMLSTAYISNLSLGKATIWNSSDFGNTWTQAASTIPATGAAQRIELTISTLDTNTCYAVVCGLDRGLFGFYKSTNGGLSWTEQMNHSTGVNILEWSRGNSPGGQGTYDLTVYADPKNANRVFVGGVNIWGSEDGGLTWSPCSYWQRIYGFTPHADQHFLTFHKLDNKFYMCNDGGIFRTDSIALGSWDDADTIPMYEFPTHWEDVSSGMQITSFYRVGVSDSIEGVLVSGAQDNGSFYRGVDGVWRNVTGGDGMDCMLHPTDTNEVITSSQYGYVYQSSDRGRNFRRINWGGSTAFEWTTPLLRNPSNPGTLYLAGTEFEESVNGSGFFRKGSMPGAFPTLISAIDIADKDEKQIVAARRVNHLNGYPSQVFVSTTGGQTWADVSQDLPDSLYPTSIKIDDRNHNKIWVTYGGFVAGVKIFLTEDGGNSWTNMSGTIPNIPVNCIEQDKQSVNNALYLGTDIGVYYTNDSLSDWVLFSKELPNVIVSDLKVQKSGRRLYASTFGRGLWSVELIDTAHFFPEDTITTPAASVSDQLWDESNFTLAPNPNNGSFSLRYEGEFSSDLSFQVINIMGKEVYVEDRFVASEQHQIDFDLDLLPGSYFLRIGKGRSSKTVKFLVD